MTGAKSRGVESLQPLSGNDRECLPRPRVRLGQRRDSSIQSCQRTTAMKD